MDNRHTILFYPTGVVHFRNLAILRQHLCRFRFCVIVEPWVEKKAPEVLASFNKEDLVFPVKNRLSGEIWKKTDVLFLSMAYPNLFRLHLVHEAVKRCIPVTAIEEVNQLALNDGIINHYFLPVDYFGVPSNVEKRNFQSLGIHGNRIRVTGWPFFMAPEPIVNGQAMDLKKEYNIPAAKRCCLLVLGSLKEFDIVSLETRKVRRQILEIVSLGLPVEYQLLIKPHPIETGSALHDIQRQVPEAILIDPKQPIEPLLNQSDVIVNRGNSQVTLLAMLQNKPLVVVPVGLKTIFHGALDEVVCNSPAEFKNTMESYQDYGAAEYDELLEQHFPLSREEGLIQVQQLFEEAVDCKKRKAGDKTLPNDSLFSISMLYAYLGETDAAKEVLAECTGKPVEPLLKLYRGKIEPEEFDQLLKEFPTSIRRWHLQALYTQRLMSDPEPDIDAATLLDGFDGEVNPHYFIDELVQRIEVEFRAGRRQEAIQLLNRLYDDYSVFDYYKQAFSMLRSVYENHSGGYTLRKYVWILKNFNTSYSRKFIKEKILP